MIKICCGFCKGILYIFCTNCAPYKNKSCLRWFVPRTAFAENHEKSDFCPRPDCAKGNAPGCCGSAHRPGAFLGSEKLQVAAGQSRHGPEIQLIYRAGMEDLAAAGKALRAQALAGFLCKCGPVMAGFLVVLACIVCHQRTIGGILHSGMLFQKILEDPAVAQHTGQAGHHALGCALRFWRLRS